MVRLVSIPRVHGFYGKGDRLCREAIRLPMGNVAQVAAFANESYLFLHTVRDGQHIVHLPDDRTLMDVFTGKPFASNFDAPAGISFLLQLSKQ